VRPYGRQSLPWADTINNICRLSLSIEMPGIVARGRPMETLDICIATYRMARGNGIDVSVFQFARELAKSHNVTLAVTDTDMDTGEIDVIRYRIGAGTGIFAAARDLDRANFDIISTHYPPVDLAASMTRIPHYMHDPGIPHFGAFSTIKDKWFWSKVNSSRLLSLRNVRCVLPVSKYLGDEFRRKYFYRGPMEALPYGIDFPTCDAEGEVPFKKYILFVGRHTPYKGVHALMEIFEEVKKEVPDASLVTIGNVDDSYRERLESLSSRIGDIHVLGYVPDVWRYYQNAAVYATCSEWEGEDRPAIEAQYMGRPVVAFDSCSHPEVVLHGTLARDRAEFKEALVGYLTGDYADPGMREKIEERFSMQRMVGQFMDIVKRTA
jgi:glycosyltransferase involved in cell wall biosynthesis